MNACGRSQFPDLASGIQPASGTDCLMPAYTHNVISRVSGGGQRNVYLVDGSPVVAVETRIFYSEWS